MQNCTGQFRSFFKSGLHYGLSRSRGLGFRLPRSNFSSLTYSKEVSNALSNGLPLVALESTIITHGMPYPENQKMALEVENAVRKSGAVPATIAIIDGKCTIGLEELELQRLAKIGPLARKVSRRDLSYITSQKLNGGTTVASTMILAEKAGIDVFATGGIGGVHRGAETTMDISADLIELGRTRVGVVCAGVKSILDIGKTLEVLETQGVPVVTLGPKNSSFPAFFSRESSFKSPMCLESPEEVAALLYQNMKLNLQCGTLIAVPTPKKCSISYPEMESFIDLSLRKCEEQRIFGKDVTPFLLGQLFHLTKGKSLSTNIDLVLNNARNAASISSSLVSHKQKSSFVPQYKSNTACLGPFSKNAALFSPETRESLGSKNPKVIAIGSVSVDSVLTLEGEHSSELLGTSYPCRTVQSFGGVAHNIAMASSLMGVPTKLISCIGSDSVPTTAIQSYLGKSEIQYKLIEKQDFSSCSYTAVNNRQGSLLLAGADMSIMEQLAYKDLEKALDDSDYICFDGNISSSLMHDIALHKRGGQKIIFEPTSGPKCVKIMDTFENSSIDYITPNLYELNILFEAIKQRGLCDMDKWWATINSYGITSSFYTQIERLSKAADFKDLTENGILQKCLHILPFVKNIIVKLGSKGTLLVSSDEVKGLSINSSSLCTPGKVLIKYYPAPSVIKNCVNASGTGDTFVGVLTALISRNKGMDDAINIAQKAAGMSLQSNASVSEEIKCLVNE
ncbi:bifunctional pseudouridylate synthase/pseudouridine kinase [Schizosaccharomyces osmophilus]|uniref:Bifunctional pseudouridylate synthase/pseudouridine kinase n=1 Tax=Schizosaccharomyces osmophilus TaxID=2545709 RepID=A0AAE9W8Q0_9SCHI|nr:bifunctional pseudouridylate synthase/pseudouridine kinase [Schizosaccharomyces osmophilus]WBW71744.1 bifunctional pseudouridylate synthase/pseudouridine kinase [Schizosaccharomyces osmophilus]